MKELPGMSTRNRILDLYRSGQLRFTSVPLPEHDTRLLRGLMPDVLEKIANPAIFEFSWEDSGIALDNDFEVYYPDVDDNEWKEALQCPLPHPYIWLETGVRDPELHNDRAYIWYIERRNERGYVATPLVFQQNTVSYFGVYFELDPDGIDNFGVPGRVTVYNCLESYAREYELDEFFRQADMLARFFRILCLPDAQIETAEPNERRNRTRVRNGKDPIAVRRTVRIDKAALIASLGARTGQTHASPSEHFRRAHQRHLRNGRVVNVRDCIVNQGQSANGPVPQDFVVS
jgi:hypothetical protein